MSEQAGIDPLNTITRVNKEHVYVILNDGIWRFLADGSAPVKVHSSVNVSLGVKRDFFSGAEKRWAYKGDGSPAILLNETFDYSSPANELTNPEISLYTSRVDGNEVKIVRNSVDVELDVPIGPFMDGVVVGDVFFDGEFLCVTYATLLVSGSTQEYAAVQYSKPKFNNSTNVWSSKRGKKSEITSIFFGIGINAGDMNVVADSFTKQIGFRMTAVADSGGIVESDNTPCNRTKTGSRYLFVLAPLNNFNPSLVSYSDTGGGEIRRVISANIDRGFGTGSQVIVPVPVIAATQELVFRLDYPDSPFFSRYLSDPILYDGVNISISTIKTGNLIIYKLNGLVEIKSISITDFFPTDILSMAATIENLFIWAGGNVVGLSGITETKCYIYDLSITRSSSGAISDVIVSSIMHTVNMPASYAHVIIGGGTSSSPETSRLISIVSRG